VSCVSVAIGKSGGATGNHISPSRPKVCAGGRRGFWLVQLIPWHKDKQLNVRKPLKTQIQTCNAGLPLLAPSRRSLLAANGCCEPLEICASRLGGHNPSMQPLQHHQGPVRDAVPVPDLSRTDRQPAADARRLPRLPGADRPGHRGRT
jgi:hypothetical protein